MVNFFFFHWKINAQKGFNNKPRQKTDECGFQADWEPARALIELIRIAESKIVIVLYDSFVLNNLKAYLLPR